MHERDRQTEREWDREIESFLWVLQGERESFLWVLQGERESFLWMLQGERESFLWVLQWHWLILSSFDCPGWLGGAKVLCILHHRGVQLILAYSWARPAILVAGKGRGGMFLFLLFLHFHSCSSFFPVPRFHLLYYLFYLFSPFLWETTQNDPQGLTCR